VPLRPKHDLRELRGSYDALTLRETYLGTAVEDYLSIVLTDEQDVPDALEKLRVIYPNIMQLRYDNTRTRADACIDGAQPEDKRTPVELFEDFYALQNGQDMTPEQRETVARLLQEIQEADA
jgi:exonuclease SbcD